ncbi:hypothetical protein J6590_022352 [Homalodisca vitripennis]|nr:hypothetical protein J6590_022352 [Homalodisca vitripennis]
MIIQERHITNFKISRLPVPLSVARPVPLDQSTSADGLSYQESIVRCMSWLARICCLVHVKDMSDKCGKCDLEISQTKDGSKCPDCNIMFHLKCLNPGYAESGKEVTRKNAKCDGCLSDTSSTASQVRDDR